MQSKSPSYFSKPFNKSKRIAEFTKMPTVFLSLTQITASHYQASKVANTNSLLHKEIDPRKQETKGGGGSQGA